MGKMPMPLHGATTQPARHRLAAGEYKTVKIVQELHVPPPVQYVDIAAADKAVFGVIEDGSVARLT